MGPLSFRWRRRARRACAVLVGAVLAVAAQAQDAALQDRVSAARLLAQRNPQQAVLQLDAIRAAAIEQRQLAARLAADEVACRALSDLDSRRGLQVAQAALDAAGPAPAEPARNAWLRLRACRAGLLFDVGRTDDALREVNLLAALDGADATHARALGLLERGVHLSRSGEFAAAQRDLIAACGLLKAAPQPADHDLCLYHLSGHYRRAGDADEALRLLRTLHDRAQQQGATYDDSVYLYATARALQSQRRWPESLASFQAALAIYEKMKDGVGIAFAEHGIAESLQRLGRAADALPHARRALDLVGADPDPREVALRTVTLASCLAETGRSAQALGLLDGVGAYVAGSGNQLLQAQWHGARADAARRLERWKDAYEAQARAAEIERALHAQQLSEQSARLRMQFNRDRDGEELSNLRALNEQGQQLRHTQAVALALFVALLLAALALVVRKVRQARQLNELASTDELTGLANRRALLGFARQAVEAAKAGDAPLSVVMVDVDFFKRINDSHGHAVGDEVLRHLARVLGEKLRTVDRLGRVGGEEFVAVLPHTGQQAAAQVAERMRASVAQSPAGAEGLAFTVSLGVASLGAGESLDALLSRADAALYQAKKEGRNRVVEAAGA